MNTFTKVVSFLFVTVALFLLFPVLSLGTSHRDNAKTFVYVPTGCGVAVIDSATNTVATTIPFYRPLLGIAISPDGKFAYVASEATQSGLVGTVFVIDTQSNTVTATIPVGSQPRDIAFTPNGKFAYVTDQGLNVVWVIDTATKKVVGQPIPLGNGATAIAITPDGAFAYVANQCGQVSSCTEGTISVISIANMAVDDTIPVGQVTPQYVAISPDGKFAYVSNTGSDTVSTIDTTKKIVVGSPISVGSYPASLAVTPDGMFIYVTNQCGEDKGLCYYGSVSVIDIDTKNVIATVPLGRHPGFLAIKSKGKVAICHKGKTIYVDEEAVDAHLKHGDHKGECH